MADSCRREYFNLCNRPRALGRDGWAGANAKIYLPYLGFYLFSGATLSFPAATVPQNRARFIGGVKRANTFSKNNCECV